MHNEKKKYPYTEHNGYTRGATWDDVTSEVAQLWEAVQKARRLYLLALGLAEREYMKANFGFGRPIFTPAYEYREAWANAWEARWREAYDVYRQWLIDNDVHENIVTRYNAQSGECRQRRIA